MTVSIPVTGQTKLVGVIANPIKHSLSPSIHNSAFECLKIDAVYLAFEIEKKMFESALESIKTLGMFGANISMPYKKKAYDLCDVLSKEAQLIGAVNTIVNKNNQLVGHNTDGIGFVDSVKAEHQEVQGKVVTILGAGGASKAVACQSALEGASIINVFKRKNETFNEVRTYFKDISNKTRIPIVVYDYSNTKQMATCINESDILVNGTQVGMGDNNNELPIKCSENLHDQLLVVDLIYYPFETALLRIAKENNCQTMNGIGMLLYQAAHAFKLWTGKEMPVEIVRENLMKQLENRGE